MKADSFHWGNRLAVMAVVAASWLLFGCRAEDKALPSSYDCRTEGRAPSVKNQKDLGTCWAFASLMALESSLLPEENLDFSEDHMSLQNGFGLSQEEGGDYTMSMAYLLGWMGPVLEEDDPYGDGRSADGLRPVKHVQEIQILPEKDYEAVKQAVYTSGGVQSSLFTLLSNDQSRSEYYNECKYAYCYVGDEKPNHDVVILGWDDDYPRENFKIGVESDGAFLCASSWGTEFGDNGYFYVSYDDSNIGVCNILYTGVEEAGNYDDLYQTDLCGWIGQLGYEDETVYAANVYQAKEEEILEAAGFYATGENTEYEIYVQRLVGEKPGAAGKKAEDAEGILKDLTERPVASGVLNNSGFYTIKFQKTLPLEKGERFAVIVKITTPGSLHPAAIEYQAEDFFGQVEIGDGEGYVSSDGRVWESVETTYDCNVCLKAYTNRKRK